MSVLLIGETGVGKEVCAELLHRRSPRAARTLLRLNCSALPEALIESELFGHEKGAFTGAAVARPGLIESADGGTVFLDEIGELPPPAQVKLLRVLDRREVMPVGGRSERIVDVRFVAATHKNLEAEIAAGRFRQDLYYRLAGMTIRIPPLRDRKDEIEPLARRFLDAAARRQGRPPVALSAEALLALQRHPWPGNIRELRNAIERALVVCGAGPIEVPHLPLEREPTGDSGPHTGPIPKIGSLGDELEEIERQRIEAVLVATGGNQSEAARRLGMSRGALLARLRAWGLTGKRPPRP
jgi:two-component system response regulator AtoC